MQSETIIKFFRCLTCGRSFTDIEKIKRIGCKCGANRYKQVKPLTSDWIKLVIRKPSIIGIFVKENILEI